jgi:hypothetical protein
VTDSEIVGSNWIDRRALNKFLAGVAHILFHSLLVALSAGIAFFLPSIVGAVGRRFWAYWPIIEEDNIYLISVEIVTAIVLLVFFNCLNRSLQDRKTAKTARNAGLIQCFRGQGLWTRRKITRLKNQQGLQRDVMVIASTGFLTFAHPQGDLRRVLRNCRDAKIMLLDPRSEGAYARTKSIVDPNIEPEKLSEEIRRSIGFLKDLKAVQKNIRLKLYGEPPFLKLAILGDYIWLKHYHPGLDVRTMPEYVLEHEQDPGGLYTPLYQYFVSRWDNPDIPEYDLATDELVYCNSSGGEARRERFDTIRQSVGLSRACENVPTTAFTLPS